MSRLRPIDQCGASRSLEVAPFGPKEDPPPGCAPPPHIRAGLGPKAALPDPARQGLAHRLHERPAALPTAGGWVTIRIHRGSSGPRVASARSALRVEAGVGIPRASVSRRHNRYLPRPDRSAEPPETEHSFQRPLVPKRLRFAIPEIERHFERRRYSRPASRL